MVIGKKVWATAERYIPKWSNGPAPELISHEAACILITSSVDITIHFADKDPVGSYKVTVPAQRTRPLQFNNLNEPAPIPLQNL